MFFKNDHLFFINSIKWNLIFLKRPISGCLFFSGTLRYRLWWALSFMFGFSLLILIVRLQSFLVVSWKIFIFDFLLFFLGKTQKVLITVYCPPPPHFVFLIHCLYLKFSAPFQNVSKSLEGSYHLLLRNFENF